MNAGAFRRKCGAGVGRALLGAGLMLAAHAARAARKPETWTIVNTPHFSVLTSAAPATAQLWALDLERFRVGLGQVLRANPARLPPVVVVIFPNEKAFAPYRPLINGQPAEVGGYFARSDSANAIGLAVGDEEEETRRIILHEATHWFVSAQRDAMPPWLAEGLAEVFSTFSADEKRFKVGDKILDHVKALWNEKPLPLATLVTTKPEALDYNEHQRTGRFYATSWLFVHWLMFGEESPGEASIERFLALEKSGKSAAEAFAGAFGGPFDVVQKKFKRYLSNGIYQRRTQALDTKATVTIDPPRPATTAEVEAALGALLLGGRSLKEALPHLQRAVELEPKMVRIWETIGLAQGREGRKREALAAFDRAAELGSQNALIWNNRAALREELENLSGGALAPEAAQRLAEDFRRAIDLDAQCEPAYVGLGGIAHSVPPNAVDAELLLRGKQAFPNNPMIAIGHAAALLRKGDGAAADVALRAVLGWKDGLTPAAEAHARNLLEDLRMDGVAEMINRELAGRRYPELLAALDGLIRDPAIRAKNREWLMEHRRSVDQWRRIDGAVNELNEGRPEKAAAALNMIRDEKITVSSMRPEIERLLKSCGAAMTAAGR